VDDAITLTISRQKKNELIGKTLLVMALAVLIGLLIAAEGKRKVAEGEQLTLEQYTADFEKYRADLLDEDFPLPVAVIGSAILFFGVLGLYEVVGSGLGRMIGRLTGNGRSSRLTTPSTGM
jgi:hypothetical protein